MAGWAASSGAWAAGFLSFFLGAACAGLLRMALVSSPAVRHRLNVSGHDRSPGRRGAAKHNSAESKGLGEMSDEFWQNIGTSSVAMLAPRRAQTSHRKREIGNSTGPASTEPASTAWATTPVSAATRLRRCCGNSLF